MWPTIVPRAHIDAQLLALVRDLQRLAKNCESNMGDALLPGYWSWVDDAVRRLRPQFSDADIDSLIRTRTYWASLPMSPIDLQVAQLVRSELAAAQQRLGDLASQFETFARRWEDAARIVVLDTSAIMGFGQEVISQNWFNLLDARPDMPLRLVVLLVVVDELDNLKDRAPQKDAKNAARQSLILIEKMIARGERPRLPDVRSGFGTATIEMFSDPPTHRRLASSDDEIVQQAAMLKALTGWPTVVATGDTGMLIRTHGAGVDGRRVRPLELLP